MFMQQTVGNSYTFRKFEAGDKPDFLSLYRTVFGESAKIRFDWKYGENPYVDEPPIYIAEDETGELIGARGHFGLPLRMGDTSGTGLVPCDTMVHPDHRREGVFTAMTKLAIQEYARSDHWCFFNFPNHLSRPADEKLGWQPVGNVPIWVRINDATTVAESAGSETIRSFAEVADPVIRLAHSVTAESARRFGSVTRHTEPPLDFLTALTTDEAVEQIQLDRSREYFDWRFATQSGRQYSFYTTRTAADAGAALITATETSGDCTITTIMDLITGPVDSRTDHGMIFDLLSAVTDDMTGSDMIQVFGGGIPKVPLLRTGFLSSAYPPLSTIHTAQELYVYDLGDGPVSTTELLEIDNWGLSFAVVDSK